MRRSCYNRAGRRVAACFIAAIAGYSMMAQVTTDSKPPIMDRTDNANNNHNYTLGPDDVITITASSAEEIGAKPIRVESNGEISVPMIGRVQASGLTLQKLEELITEELKNYVKQPVVTINIVEFASKSVTIIGAVNNPGIHQAHGSKKLLDMISLAGGLRNEAGTTITVTRNIGQGVVPVPGATSDSTGKFSVGKVEVDSLLNGSAPQENIAIQPYDTITVPFADTLYVLGAVHKPGGFAIHRSESLSVLSALSMAEGVTRTASPQQAKILRRLPHSLQRDEIAVNLHKILSGKSTDVSMQRDDILLIPDSKMKTISVRAAEAAIQIGTGMAVYGR